MKQKNSKTPTYCTKTKLLGSIQFTDYFFKKQRFSLINLFTNNNLMSLLCPAKRYI